MTIIARARAVGATTDGPTRPPAALVPPAAPAYGPVTRDGDATPANGSVKGCSSNGALASAGSLEPLCATGAKLASASRPTYTAVRRADVLWQLADLRDRFVRIARHDPQLAVDGADQRHTVPIARMSQYEEAVRRAQPLRRIDEDEHAPVQMPSFGNPFRTIKVRQCGGG